MRVIFSLALSLMVMMSYAQTLRGIVFDSDTKEPLGSAIVVWKGTSEGVLTNSSGEFELAKSAKTDTLLIAFVSYSTDTLVYRGESYLRIKLKPLQLGTIEIVNDKEGTRIKSLDPQAFQVMNEKELCKAACCNLSESFETNASIDASFTDAITGTRQIKMLGLDGRYTQLQFDNIPTMRGLASIYGLGFEPGPWIKEISITKGVGSILAGYESITGQINIAHKSTEMKERLFINLYNGSQGRYEFNGVYRKRLSPSLNTVWMAHGAMSNKRFDMNEDGFLDNPLFQNGVARTEWIYEGRRGLRGNYSLSVAGIENMSGQFDYNPSDVIASQLWGVQMNALRSELQAKTGYVFEEPTHHEEEEHKQAEGEIEGHEHEEHEGHNHRHLERSIGSQISISWHDQEGHYGNRQYDGQQLNARINLLYATTLAEHGKLTAGLSYVHDIYTEQLDSLNFDRTEIVPGIYSEFSWNWEERAMLIAGLRYDHNNYYGHLITPRLHYRINWNEKNTFKLAAGMGYRSPNVLMDNVGMFASNRTLLFSQENPDKPFGLDIERAVNFGLMLIHKTKIFHRDATITLDVYRTDFVNQIVVDWETTRQVSFYNLTGKSYSNNIQFEAIISPVKRLEIRTAYRWLDAKTTYNEVLLERPLVAKHRFFVNVGYASKEKENGSKWMFDVTARWLGQQRLPSTFANPHEYMLHGNSDAYWIFNAQVAYHFNKHFEVYVGGENLGNFMQMSPIIASEDPASSYFDASLIWGPVFGRMGYAGLRWRIA